jgi:hypothetical protein
VRFRVTVLLKFRTDMFDWVATVPARVSTRWDH